MDKPICRLCEKRHWPRDGCDFGGSGPDSEKKSKKVEKAKVTPAVTGVTPGVTEFEPVVEKGTGSLIVTMDCLCGCGREVRVEVKARYFNATCRQRAKRARGKSE